MDTLKDKIYTILKACIGSETVIYADQNTTRPSLPYWTIKVQSIIAIGGDEVIQSTTNDDSQNIIGVRQATVQVKRMGEDSEIECANLLSVLHTTTNQALWKSNKISCFYASQVTNLAIVLDNSSIEERAGLDIFVRFGTDLLDTGAGMINTVSIEGEYETVDITAQFDANDDLTHTIIASSL